MNPCLQKCKAYHAKSLQCSSAVIGRYPTHHMLAPRTMCGRPQVACMQHANITSCMTRAQWNGRFCAHQTRSYSHLHVPFCFTGNVGYPFDSASAFLRLDQLPIFLFLAFSAGLRYANSAGPIRRSACREGTVEFSPQRPLPGREGPVLVGDWSLGLCATVRGD